MTVAVTRPLEEALSGIVGLQRVRTLTVRGSAELSLDFRAGADMQFALSQVQGRLAAARPSLPEGLELSAERLTPSVFPMLQYELTGADPLVLRDLAEFTLRPRLAGLPDAGQVEVQGGRVRQITVQLDPARLVANRICRRSGGPRHRLDRSGGGGRTDRPRLPAIRRHRLRAHQHTGRGRPGRGAAERAAPGPGGRPGHGELRRRGPVPDRRGERTARRAGEHRPPAERQHAEAAGRRAALRWIRSAPLLPAGVRLQPVYDQAALVRDSMRQRARRHAPRRRARRARAAPLSWRVAHHARRRRCRCR